ncbi:hypothetical protein [Planctobacterium marinum]|uniref:hypothetical protein n=1 Tax=Planctobacterium marinum TaxID=1631968 RepID=UPI001E5AB148|nr:hypothetical protein [Planctobacterium marinum]MCC2606411.1 hypothetical protein [Planctobacterium marinum]
MIAAVSIIMFMVMFLIYFVVKNQTMAKELREFRYLARTAENKSKFALVTVDSLAAQIQKMLSSQLDSAQKRGLIKGEQYEKTAAIFKCFESVVMQCCEHGSTVEEALKRNLTSDGKTLDDIRKFISEMPSEVRVPWVKNDVGSFVIACTNIINHFMNPTSKAEPAEKTEAG